MPRDNDTEVGDYFARMPMQAALELPTGVPLDAPQGAAFFRWLHDQRSEMSQGEEFRLWYDGDGDGTVPYCSGDRPVIHATYRTASSRILRAWGGLWISRGLPILVPLHLHHQAVDIATDMIDSPHDLELSRRLVTRLIVAGICFPIQQIL